MQSSQFHRRFRRSYPFVALVAAIVMIPASALPQSSAIDPFTYTCGDLLAAAPLPPGHSDTNTANLMALWAIGYFYGRFDRVEGSDFNEGSFDQVRDDMVTALTTICPNVPDMPIAEFASNLADDFERSIGAN